MREEAVAKSWEELSSYDHGAKPYVPSVMMLHNNINHNII